MTIRADAVGQLQDRLGYVFRDPSLLQLALTHRSAGADNFERFEFLGDAALGFVIAQLLFDAKPAASEQQLTLMRAKLVNADALAAIARDLQLGALLNLGAGERRSGGAERRSILADALEAIIGAVVCDGGLAAATTVVGRAFQGRLRTIDDADLKDAKTRLQEYVQGRGLPPPTYTVVATTGADHAPTFAVDCAIDPLRILTQGEGRSRRLAEKAAAVAALRRLGIQ